MNQHYFMGTIPINPNNFPAKMWSLVINPKNPSIRWDASGEGVIIDQQLFEAELLSPQMQPFDGRVQHVDVFKTFNFTSFVRQLNLYGFKKVVVDPDKHGATGRSPTGGILHHFHNPHFRQDRPELLVNLKRLTSSNKAKMKAGLEVNCRPPNRFPRLPTANGGRPKVEKRGSVYIGEGHRASPYRYHQNVSQSVKEYVGTPIPPRGWVLGHGDAPTPTIFYTDMGIPISVFHGFPADASCPQSSPTTVHIQQGSQGLAIPGPKFNGFIPQHAQYRPGFSSPGNYVNTHQLYVQKDCPVGFLSPGNQNQDWQSSENQESKKSDVIVNLDTVFQLVGELQASPKIRMVKVGTPDKHFLATPKSGPQPTTTIHSSSHPVSSQPDSSANSSSVPVFMDANPVTPCGPIIIAVPGKVPQGIAITIGGPAGEPVKMEEQEPGSLDVETNPINASQKQHQGEGRRGRMMSVCPRRPKAADSNLNLQI